MSMLGTPIVRADVLNLLGVQFSDDGSVKRHIQTKAATAGKLVGMLRRQSRYLSEEARFHIYVATIRPVMEYGCPVFVNAPDGCLSLLDRIQRRAARLFPGLCHRLDSLGLRRNVAALSQLYRIVDHTAPNSVIHHLSPRFLKVNRTTRGSESCNLRSLEIPKSRTTAHQRSFLPQFSRRWNELNNEAAFASSLTVFKRCAVRSLRRTEQG